MNSTSRLMPILFTLLIYGCALPIVDEMEQHDCTNAELLESKVSAVAIMKSLEMGLDIENPSADVQRNFNHGDYRFFMVLDGWGAKIPGIQVKYQEYVCNYGARLIEGTAGDSYERSEHADLDLQAKEYAEQYNFKLLKLLIARNER